jgi:hypothetical protein
VPRPTDSTIGRGDVRRGDVESPPSADPMGRSPAAHDRSLFVAMLAHRHAP